MSYSAGVTPQNHQNAQDFSTPRTQNFDNLDDATIAILRASLPRLGEQALPKATPARKAIEESVTPTIPPAFIEKANETKQPAQLELRADENAREAQAPFGSSLNTVFMKLLDNLVQQDHDDAWNLIEGIITKGFNQYSKEKLDPTKIGELTNKADVGSAITDNLEALREKQPEDLITTIYDIVQSDAAGVLEEHQIPKEELRDYIKKQLYFYKALITAGRLSASSPTVYLNVREIIAKTHQEPLFRMRERQVIRHSEAVAEPAENAARALRTVDRNTLQEHRQEAQAQGQAFDISVCPKNLGTIYAFLIRSIQYGDHENKKAKLERLEKIAINAAAYHMAHSTADKYIKDTYHLDRELSISDPLSETKAKEYVQKNIDAFKFHPTNYYLKYLGIYSGIWAVAGTLTAIAYLSVPTATLALTTLAASSAFPPLLAAIAALFVIGLLAVTLMAYFSKSEQQPKIEKQVLAQSRLEKLCPFFTKTVDCQYEDEVSSAAKAQAQNQLPETPKQPITQNTSGNTILYTHEL